MNIIATTTCYLLASKCQATLAEDMHACLRLEHVCANMNLHKNLFGSTLHSYELHRNVGFHYEDICKMKLVYFQRGLPQVPRSMSHLISQSVSQLICAFLFFKTHIRVLLQTQCQQYLRCYLPDFDETLKVISCEHLEEIPTVTVTFVHATLVLAIFVYIRNISAVTDPILMTF